MGYAYHYLIPPAILLDNPGITRNEFVEQLVGDNSYQREFQMSLEEEGTFPDCQWDLEGFDNEGNDYSRNHMGLHGLAETVL